VSPAEPAQIAPICVQQIQGIPSCGHDQAVTCLLPEGALRLEAYLQRLAVHPDAGEVLGHISHPREQIAPAAGQHSQERRRHGILTFPELDDALLHENVVWQREHPGPRVVQRGHGVAAAGNAQEDPPQDARVLRLYPQLERIESLTMAGELQSDRPTPCPSPTPPTARGRPEHVQAPVIFRNQLTLPESFA